MRGGGLTTRLVDALYRDAMVLADEARHYFDARGRLDRDALSPLGRVAFTCESLRVTTRLMHVIAWLLTQRAVAAGELSEGDARHPDRRLGRVATRGDMAISLPNPAQVLIDASHDLYERVRRLDARSWQAVCDGGPARGLMARLENAF